MVEFLIWLVIWLVVLGGVLFILNMLVDAVPMPANYKQGIKVFIGIIALVILLILAMRLLGSLPAPNFGRLN